MILFHYYRILLYYSPQVDLFLFVFWSKLKTPKRQFEIIFQWWKEYGSNRTVCIRSYFTIIVLFQRSAGHHRIVWDSEKSNWAFHPDSPLQILLSSLAWNYRLIIFRRFLFLPSGSKYLPCKSTCLVCTSTMVADNFNPGD